MSKKARKQLDVLFMIDATRSMDSTIKAAHDKAEDLAFQLNSINRSASYRFGCICYRDPVDYILDIHQVFDFNPDIENFSLFLEKVEAFGGGDIPEDFVGALNSAFEKLSWNPEAKKAIIWIADAPAHGKRFCGEENHQEEEAKLVPLVKRLAEEGFYFVGISLNGGADRTFSEMRSIYNENGGKSFKIESFTPDADHEVDDIGKTMQISTIGVVDEALKDLT